MGGQVLLPEGGSSRLGNDEGRAGPKEPPRRHFYPARLGVTEADEAAGPEALAAPEPAARAGRQDLVLPGLGAASQAAARSFGRMSPPVQFVAAAEANAPRAGPEMSAAQERTFKGNAPTVVGRAARDWMAPQAAVESRQKLDHLALELEATQLRHSLSSYWRRPGSQPESSPGARGEHRADDLDSARLALPAIGNAGSDARLLGGSSVPEIDLAWLGLINQNAFAARACLPALGTADGAQPAGLAAAQADAFMSGQGAHALGEGMAEILSFGGLSSTIEPAPNRWGAAGSKLADGDSLEDSSKPFAARNAPQGTQSFPRGTPILHEASHRPTDSFNAELLRSKREGVQPESLVLDCKDARASQRREAKPREEWHAAGAKSAAREPKAKPRSAVRKKRPAEGEGGPVPTVLDDVECSAAPLHPTSAIPPEVRGTMSTHWVLLGQDLQRKGVTLGIERFLAPKPSSSRSSSSEGSTCGGVHSKSTGGSTADCPGKQEQDAEWEDRSGGGMTRMEAPAGEAAKDTGAPLLLRRLSRVMDALHDPQGAPGNRLRVEEESCWGLAAHTPWSQQHSNGVQCGPPSAAGAVAGAPAARALVLVQGLTLSRPRSVADPLVGLGAEAETGTGYPVRLRLVEPITQGKGARLYEQMARTGAPAGAGQPFAWNMPLPHALRLQPVCADAAVLKDLVMLAARAVENQNPAQFEALAVNIQRIARRRGSAVERLGQVMLDMLTARAQGEGFAFANRRIRVTSQDFNKARMWYFTGSPAHGFLNIALYGVMLPTLQGKRSVHFVLVGEAVLPQLGSIIKLLASRPALEWQAGAERQGLGGAAQGPGHQALRKLRVTSVSSWQLVRPGRADVENMKEPGRVANLLRAVAANAGVEFEFSRLNLVPEDLHTNLEMLLQDAARRDPEEVLVCCGSLDMKFVQVAEHGTPEEASPVLLKKYFEESRPDLIAIGDEAVDASCNSFLRRLDAYFDFALGEFQVHDAISTPAGKKALHVLEQQYFFPNLLSTLAYDGPQARLQPRSAAGWAAVMASAGYPPCRISPRVSEALHESLESYPDGFGVLHTETAVQMMWRGMPVLCVLFWRRSNFKMIEL